MTANLTSNTSKDAVAYINGIVYSVDQSHPWAEAFIVSPDGLFTAVGSTKDIREQAIRDGMVIYNLRGQFIMPAIHDAHMHVMYAGFALLNQIELGMDTTPENLAGRIEQGAFGCAYAHAFGNWLTAGTFTIPEFDRARLDEKFPDTPMYIMAGAGHSLYVNTATLKESGYDVDGEPDGQATRIVRRKDGGLTGELSETAMDKAAVSMPRPALSHVKRAIKAGIREAHKVGVTSIQEPSANTILLSALSELEQDQKLDLDIYAHIVDSPEFLAREGRQDLHDLIERADEFNSKHVYTNFVKFILDGVPVPPLFTHCGLDETGTVDESKIIVTDLAERMLHHDSKGRTVKIHATGHGSVRRALDAISAARERNPHGPRHEISHCNSVNDADYTRFHTLNVTAEMSPGFFFSHPLAAATPVLFDWNFSAFFQHNTLLTLGSDWGGSFEPGLFPHCARIVEKVGSGSKERGGELLCHMLTLAGAKAVGKEEVVGSIEVGKKANFIAVDRNVARGEFEGAKVLRTWFEGEVVWEGGDR